MTLKDHIESFLKNPTLRLINQAKYELERISNVILDTTIKNILGAMNSNK